MSAKLKEIMERVDNEAKKPHIKLNFKAPVSKKAAPTPREVAQRKALAAISQLVSLQVECSAYIHV